MNWHIDYLTLTVWGDDVTKFFELFFVNTFRNLINQGHGGRFYLETYKTDLGITVRTNPVNSIENRTTLEFPGQACQMIGYIGLASFLDQLQVKFDKVRINRIDLAFDHCPFTVEDVLKCVEDDNLRSYFKREKVKYYNSPYEVNELGEVGTSGLYLGGRSSTRMIRIYNKHGFTRLEMEVKHEKAIQVGLDVLKAGSIENALIMAMGHLRDYIDFFEGWWEEFIADFDRNYSKLPDDVQEITIENIKSWFEKQVASAFFVMANMDGRYLEELFEIGKDKYKNSRYQGLIELAERQKIYENSSIG